MGRSAYLIIDLQLVVREMDVIFPEAKDGIIRSFSSTLFVLSDMGILDLLGDFLKMLMVGRSVLVETDWTEQSVPGV